MAVKASVRDTARAAVDGQVWLKDGDRIHVGPILVFYRTSPTGIETQTQAS